MIGIDLNLKSVDTEDLINIFDNINFDKYNFKTIEDEAYSKNHLIKNFDFKKIINNEEYCFILFLNVQFYSKKIKEFSTIKNYNDFLESNCELILLVVDGQNIEIYFKDNELKKQIIKNIKGKKYIFDIKTTENDGRTRMSVY